MFPQYAILTSGFIMELLNIKLMLTLLEVLEILANPNECIHVAIGKYFSYPRKWPDRQHSHQTSTACCTELAGKPMCSFCRGDYEKAVITPDREEQVQVLTVEVFRGIPTRLSQLPKLLTNNENDIWPQDKVTIKKVSQK